MAQVFLPGDHRLGAHEDWSLSFHQANSNQHGQRQAQQSLSILFHCIQLLPEVGVFEQVH